MDNNNLVSQCRLCSADFQHGVLVFSEEGKRLYLQAKIRKYLYITVSMEDIFPKIVCDNCCKKLDGIHKFATMAVKNQDKFSKFVSETTNCSSTEPKRGLLHTYLTKGITEKQAEDTEEMEVRVDPMLFLQCNSEETRSEEDDEEENMSDIAPELEQHTNFKTPSLEQIENEDSYSKEYKCSMCSRVFHTEYTLQNHTWCHLPKNRRVVLNNHNNFYLKVERVDEDGNKDEHSAEAQQMSTYDESGENANGLRFSCPICGKIISTKGNLKVHLETHRPKGKYGCDICGRIFKTQCNLHRHKEYHSGIQFTCAVCGRVYPTNSTLRAHSITHSDLRPHKCPLCDKTFKRNQDLKFHINQHTGARPYQCPYCPKAFASSGNCFSHRKRMHPLEVERDRERAAKIMR